MFENLKRGRQARNFTTTVPKILDLKSSSEQIFSENWRWVPLFKDGVKFSLSHRQQAFRIIPKFFFTHFLVPVIQYEPKATRQYDHVFQIK